MKSSDGENHMEVEPPSFLLKSELEPLGQFPLHSEP